MWEGLFEMCAVFKEVAIKISQLYCYLYEYMAIVTYLQAVKHDIEKKLSWNIDFDYNIS
jgi:hypothetical protein